MLSGVTSRRRQAANGHSAAEEHSPVTMPVAFRPAQHDQRHQGDGPIGAAAQRIEIQHALAARLDGEQFFRPIAFVVGQIAGQGDFQGPLALAFILTFTHLGIFHKCKQQRLPLGFAVAVFSILETQLRILGVGSALLDCNPLAPKLLGNRARCVRSGERVQHHVARFGQELDKEPGQLGREPRRDESSCPASWIA